MRIDVFTIFPDMVTAFADASLLGKARARGTLDLRVHDVREQAPDPTAPWTTRPFGGGAGMVLMAEPVFAAVEAAAPRDRSSTSARRAAASTRPSPGELAASDGFSLLCGRYEGVDERVREHLVDGELSIGDYVLGGGEVAAMVVLEAVGRLVPGVMGNDASADDESFSDGLLEYPHYTRPAELRGLGRARGAAVRRPRQGRTVAPRAGVGSDAGPAAGPDRGSGRSQRRGSTAARRVRPLSTPPPILICPTRPELTAMQPTDLVDQSSLRTDIPDFGPGDTLKVHVRVVEGSKERLQVFQGAVIGRQGDGLRETFTVRKVSYGVGVERTFPVHAPTVAKIEVVTRGDVRRAKLYYLRDRVGKAAKIKEKRER